MAIYRGSGGSGTASDTAAVEQVSSLTSEAEGYKDAAAASATAAALSEAAAQTAETNAETAETNAETAQAAAETAQTAAQTAQTAAETAQTAAETAQTAAETAKTNAETAESNASSSATAAATSATSAAASATTATTQATNAASSATSAASSASTATTKASEASTSATNAASSASSASSAQTAAEAAKDAALAALDNFDDRYLGVKTSDPTLDNDGNALVTGALYFNSTDDVMKVYDGAAWRAAYADLSGALLITNNLSDVSSASAARTNLGLGTAATTASTDYATAAQGTLADSALQSSDIGVSIQAYSSVLAGTTASYTTAEETKLAGIETGADVTDTANVTAAGALMDSEVTNLAQVKAFDSANYATAAQGTLADSALQSSDIGVSVQAYSAVLAGTTASFTTADETKLDGIESGATADQTAAEILTAIKTVDGSGSGLDADTLDGKQSSEFSLRQLTTPSLNSSPADPLVGSNVTWTYTVDDDSNTLEIDLGTTNFTYSSNSGATGYSTSGSVVTLTGITGTSVSLTASFSATGTYSVSARSSHSTENYISSDWSTGDSITPYSEYSAAQTPTTYTIYNTSGNYTIPNTAGNVVYGEMYGAGGGGHWGNCGNYGGRGWFMSGISDAGWSKGQTKAVVVGTNPGGCCQTGNASTFAGGQWVAQGGVAMGQQGFGSTAGGSVANSSSMNVGGNRYTSEQSWSTQNPANDGQYACNADRGADGGVVIYY